MIEGIIITHKIMGTDFSVPYFRMSFCKAPPVHRVNTSYNTKQR